MVWDPDTKSRMRMPEIVLQHAEDDQLSSVTAILDLLANPEATPHSSIGYSVL